MSTFLLVTSLCSWSLVTRAEAFVEELKSCKIHIAAVICTISMSNLRFYWCAGRRLQTYTPKSNAGLAKLLDSSVSGLWLGILSGFCGWTKVLVLLAVVAWMRLAFPQWTCLNSQLNIQVLGTRHSLKLSQGFGHAECS